MPKSLQFTVDIGAEVVLAAVRQNGKVAASRVKLNFVESSKFCPPSHNQRQVSDSFSICIQSNIQ